MRPAGTPQDVATSIPEDIKQSFIRSSLDQVKAMGVELDHPERPKGEEFVAAR
jgi:hypothetical protein